MESLLQAQQRLEDYEAVMNAKRAAYSQSRKVRNLFKKDKARLEARNRSVEENRQLAEARKARRIARASLQPSVKEVRRGAEALGLGYTITTTPQGRLYRVKHEVDPAVLEARKAKTAAFHEARAKANFIKEVERAFEIAQERIDDPSVDPWFLPKPDKAKAEWFPLVARVLYLEKGERKALKFETLRAYADYRRSTRGFPETEAMKIEAERQAALDRAAQRRKGAAEPRRQRDDEDEIIDPDADEGKQLAHQAYLHSVRKERRRQKTREDRDTARNKPPKHMRFAKANLARSYKGSSGIVGRGKRNLVMYERLFEDAKKGKVDLTFGQVFRAALEGQEDARKILPFKISRVKSLLKEYPVEVDMLLYSRADGARKPRLLSSKSALPLIEAERRLARKKEQLVRMAASEETKDDDSWARPSEQKRPRSPVVADSSPPPIPPEDAYSEAQSEVRLSEVDSPPPPSQGNREKTREGQIRKAKPTRKGMPNTTESDKGSKSEPLPEEAAYGSFVPSASPNTRCLFPYDLVPRPSSHFAYDPMGAPFCGYVAVDLAARGKAEGLDHYREWCRDTGGLALGSAEHVEKYARWRGYNLRIVDYHFFTEKYDGRPNPAHDTIFLAHDSQEEHYYLIAECVETNNNVNLPQVTTTCMWYRVGMRSLAVATVVAIMLWGLYYAHALDLLPFRWEWFMFLVLLVPASGIHYVPTIKFSPPFYNDNDRDVRLMLSRRDRLEMQASYSKGTLARHWHIWGFSLCWTTVDRPRIVSLPRFHEIHAQAQILAATGRDPMSLMDLSLQYRGDNTDPSLPGVFRNTSFLACKLAQYVDGTVESHFIETRNTAYNGNASYVVATEDAVRRFRVRNATTGYGNKVLKAKAKLTAIVGDPVAVCKLPIQSDVGQIGPGWYPRTDGASVVAAFALRSMASPEITGDQRAFVEWSKKFMEPFISEVVLDPLEPSAHELYRKATRGKKSQKQVEAVLAEYDEYLLGKRRKKFERHSAFVKFENSGKLEQHYGVKPRLIMTMSDLMSVECAGVIEVIHAFNRTSFRKYQVKEMTPEEMINRIAEASSRPHMVSDYSSFEASINETIREIEIHVMDEALRLNGWYRTAEAVRKYTRPRCLKTAEAIFQISSRCSGDYWTSFGNGIVNVCIMAYCAHMKGEDPYAISMIAEGDDGLVAAHVPDRTLVNSLGFKYSVALAGNRPGDVDFLRSRWVNGRRYLDIGRCFSATWLKNGHRLAPEKQAFLVRCVANSLYHLSPGHPVIAALVWRLRKDHPKWKSFRGYLKYLDVYSATGHKIFEEPKDYAFFVNEDMRSAIAAGAEGFPPISVATQLALEHTLMFDKIPYVGSRLNEYADFGTMVSSNVLLNPWVGDDTIIRSILAVVGAEPNYVQAKGVAIPHA